jgi:hypothetical protein
VLKINQTHITYLDDGTDGMVLTLPFRKTHQAGGMLLYELIFLCFFMNLMQPFSSMSQTILSVSIA